MIRPNTVIAFDIETVPDVLALRRLHDLPADLADAEVVEYAFQRMRAENGHDFLPPFLHCPIVISAAMRRDDKFIVHSLCQPELSEKEILQRFFSAVGDYTPQLVSWNGKGFDMPVLHYRCLRHSVQAARYWELGEGSQDFKWNNYISRYHLRHLDLMDTLSLYQARNFSRLEQIAITLGLPGKQGLAGAEVWPAWQAGRHQEIRHYCEGDAVLTYLVYLHFQHMRGFYNDDQLQQETLKVRNYLTAQGAVWQEFLTAWSE